MYTLCFSCSTVDQLTRFFTHHRNNGKSQIACVAPADQTQPLNSISDHFRGQMEINHLSTAGLPMRLDSATEKFIRAHKIDEIIIIVDSESKRLRELPGEFTINIGPYFDLCRDLHRMGFENISFFNLNQILKRSFSYFLDDLQDRGNGKRCFVVGNGPSLNKIDMTCLKDEVTFGCNRCYLGFERWGFPFTYWTVGDRLQVEQHLTEWEFNIPEQVIKFIPFEYCSLLNLQNLCPINFMYDYDNFPQFSDDPGVLYLGNTSVYYLMEIAVIMGYTELILVGVDNRYTIPKNQIQNDRWTDTDSRNHFDPGYCQSGKRKFVVPRPERAEQAYTYAAEWCKQRGIRVLNASPGTSLNMFPHVEFASLFAPSPALS